MEQPARETSIDILRSEPPELDRIRKQAFDEYLQVCSEVANLHGKSRVPGGNTFAWDWPTSTLRLGVVTITFTPFLGSAAALRCFHVKLKAKITVERQVTLTVVPVLVDGVFMWAALDEVFSSSALIDKLTCSNL